MFGSAPPHQGNVCYIVDKYGNLVVSYNYDAWGNIVSKYFFKYGVANAKTSYSITLGTVTYTASDIDGLNSHYYRGYYLDKETNFYYLITRYYDPKTGRFISPDDPKYLDYTIAYGHNRYTYCVNNPVMYIDPSGQSVVGGIFAFWGILGFVLTLVDCEQGSQYSHAWGGASSVANGASAICTGISLLSYGPVGWVLGGLSILVGLVTMAFGSAEIQEGFTGNNWIKDSFPVSDEVYNAIYTSSNIASALLSFGGNIYKTSQMGQRAYALQNIKKFGYTNSARSHIGSPYFTRKYGSYGISTSDVADIRPYANSLWAQKTIIRYGTMTVDKFGWIFTYDGYRLGVNTNLRLIFHLGYKF